MKKKHQGPKTKSERCSACKHRNGPIKYCEKCGKALCASCIKFHWCSG